MKKIIVVGLLSLSICCGIFAAAHRTVEDVQAEIDRVMAEQQDASQYGLSDEIQAGLFQRLMALAAEREQLEVQERAQAGKRPAPVASGAVAGIPEAAPMELKLPAKLNMAEYTRWKNAFRRLEAERSKFLQKYDLVHANLAEITAFLEEANQQKSQAFSHSKPIGQYTEKKMIDVVGFEKALEGISNLQNRLNQMLIAASGNPQYMDNDYLSMQSAEIKGNRVNEATGRITVPADIAKAVDHRLIYLVSVQQIENICGWAALANAAALEMQVNDLDRKPISMEHTSELARHELGELQPSMKWDGERIAYAESSELLHAAPTLNLFVRNPSDHTFANLYILSPNELPIYQGDRATQETHRSTIEHNQIVHFIMGTGAHFSLTSVVAEDGRFVLYHLNSSNAPLDMNSNTMALIRYLYSLIRDMRPAQVSPVRFEPIMKDWQLEQEQLRAELQQVEQEIDRALGQGNVPGEDLLERQSQLQRERDNLEEEIKMMPYSKSVSGDAVDVAEKYILENQQIIKDITSRLEKPELAKRIYSLIQEIRGMKTSPGRRSEVVQQRAAKIQQTLETIIERYGAQ